MKTDKSAEEIYDKHIAGPPFNTGVTEAVVNAMHQFADQEVAKYKAVIEKLLPLAEAGSAYYRQNAGFDWVAEKEKSKIIINEAHDLLKLTSGNDPQSYADRD